MLPDRCRVYGILALTEESLDITLSHMSLDVNSQVCVCVKLCNYLCLSVVT